MAHIRAHFFILPFAFLVGFVYAGPDLYHASTPGYQGILMVEASDADFYLTVINKSYDSTGVIRDPFHYEYRNEGHPFQYFPLEFVLGKLGALFNLRIDQLVILMELLFPSLLTILLYALGYWFSRSRLTAGVVAIAMLLGTELVHPNGLSNLLNTFLFRGQFSEFLAYSRPVNPQVSALLFFATLGTLFNLFKKSRSTGSALIAGISVGLLAYIYPYYWMFAVVVLGVMGLHALMMRHWQYFSMVCLAGITTLLVMTPFLLATLPVFLHGGGAVTQAIPVHRIIVEKVILLPLFLYTFIYIWAWRSSSGERWGVWAATFAQKYFFILLLLVAGLIVSNHQVIDGKMFYQQHFHFFTNIPLFVLAMSILYMEILRLVPKMWRIAGALALIVVSVWFAVGVQVASYQAHSTEGARYQTLAPVFAYLREQEPEKVILTDSYLSTRATIYTKDFSYSAAYDTSFLVPQEQLRHDYFVTLAIRGVQAEEVRSYLYTHKAEVGGRLFIGTYWRDLCGSYSCFPDSVLENLVPQYAAFLQQPLTQAIRTHRIDYILWDSKAEPGWKLKDLVRQPPVFENGDFKLYSLLP